MPGVTINIVRVYNDTELYEKALEKSIGARLSAAETGAYFLRGICNAHKRKLDKSTPVASVQQTNHSTIPVKSSF